MNKDSIILKILSDIKLRDEPTLTPDQEDLLKLALDSEEQFLQKVEQIFNKPNNRDSE